MVSRQLNDTATRHLYHHVHGQRWWLLARTLLARNDLARVIRSIRIGFYWTGDEIGCPPEVAAYYKSQRKIYLDALPEDARREAMSRLSEDELDTGSNTNIQANVLCSLCPNLETLGAIIGYFDVFRFSAPDSMPLLRKIALSHADTELGIDLQNVAALFRAAPNITHAVFHMASACSTLDGVSLPKLTSLEFQSSALDAPLLVEILSVSVNLEILRYEMGGACVGYDQFGIQEAQAAFLTHAPNLKSLSLEAGDNDNWDEDWDAAEAGEMGKVLEKHGVQFEFKPYVW